jgi:hypothetical protein
MGVSSDIDGINCNNDKPTISGEGIMRTYFKIAGIFFSLLFLNGCFLTKLVTVPMRVGGAVLSIVPLAGDAVHDAIDETAEQIDKAPL